MKYLKQILLILVILLSGCEKEELLNPELMYKEKVVVNCQITPENYFPGLSLTRTLPLDIPFDISLAEIKDATIYLRVDGIKIIPLHYTSGGMYMPLYNFTVQENEYYELFGQWNDFSFYAKTKIPVKPEINSVNINMSSYYAEADVNTFPDEVYAALWAIDLGSFTTASDFYNISTPTENVLNESLIVRSASYPVEYQSAAYNGSRYIKVYSFDRSFNDYFNTKLQTEEINNPYVQGSGNTIWNIQGENVIGMFIGINSSDFIKVN